MKWIIKDWAVKNSISLFREKTVINWLEAKKKWFAKVITLHKEHSSIFAYFAMVLKEYFWILPVLQLIVQQEE